MKTELFDFNLPEALIAQHPIDKRDHSRLLVMNKETGAIEHKHFYNIIDELNSNDVLVMNNTKVLPARLIGLKEDTMGKVEAAKSIPTISPMGIRVDKALPFEQVSRLINLSSLYRMSWGAKKVRGQEWTDLKHEFDRRRWRMLEEAQKEGWIQPQAVYGYFPVWKDGYELIVFDPQTSTIEKPIELTRLSFPRQKDGEGLCLSDYFLAVGSKQFDILPLQVVTVGKAATERIAQLDSEDRYSDGYFLHGLAVQMAEASAEFLHQRIKQELGLSAEQGERYSWGYPALPWLKEHRKVFDLLPAEKELGLRLTEAYFFVPEQTTAAMVVHHPQAKLFDSGISRIDLLLED